MEKGASETFGEYFGFFFTLLFSTRNFVFVFKQRVLFLLVHSLHFAFVACCKQKFICFFIQDHFAYVQRHTAWLVLNLKCKMTGVRFGIQLKFVCVYMLYWYLHKNRVRFSFPTHLVSVYVHINFSRLRIRVAVGLNSNATKVFASFWFSNTFSIFIQETNNFFCRSSFSIDKLQSDLYLPQIYICRN